MYLDVAIEAGRTGVSVTRETYDVDLESYVHITMYRPKIGQVAVIASDRSDIVKAEENLENAYQDISTILNEIPAPICVVKKQQKYFIQ